MHRLLSFLLCALLVASTGCASLYQKRVVFQKHPVAVRVVGKYVDEESPLDYVVRFRNVGREIMSFDYTLADEKGVPHVDKEGPNSGLIENLYPGSEVEVPNPSKLKNAYVTLGTVVYGKQSKEEIQRIFSPGTTTASGNATAEAPLF